MATDLQLSMEKKPFSAIQYVLKDVLRSFFSFFSDWYIFIPHLYWKKVKWFLHDLDKNLALKAMVRNWLSPFYQDYNIAGYFIGIFIRTFWIIFDLVFYCFLFIFIILAFLAWLLILPGIVWLILINLV